MLTLVWEDVLDRYGTLVYRLAYQNTRSRQDAEDVAQEVFVALVRSAPRLEDETHLKAWLIRCTGQRCKNLAASAWKRHTVPLEERAEQTASDSTSAVLAAVGSLPQKYRDTVYLHYIEGYTAEEIGALLGCGKNTVLSRLMRARRLLKVLLKEEFDFE